MLDNQLIALIFQILDAGAAAAGIPTVLYKQSYQPTKQGANSVPTCYLNKLFDEVYGSPLRLDQWNEDKTEITHTESQQYATHFQLTALAYQDPSDVNSKTASDILNLSRYTLQSDVGIQSFQAAGVGIQRVTQVRNTPFLDEHNNWEYQPSFDFIITHKQTITSTTPVIKSTDIEIYEV